LPALPTTSLYEDETGRLWAGTLQGAFRRTLPAGPWESVKSRLADLIPAVARAVSLNGANGVGARRDRQGNVWVGPVGEALWRTSPGSGGRASGEHITVRPGLSSDVVSAVYQDREGNVGVGTQSGPHELTPRKVTPVREIGPVAAVQATPDGSAWLAS